MNSIYCDSYVDLFAYSTMAGQVVVNDFKHRQRTIFVAMKLAILADPKQKAEWLSKQSLASVELYWASSLEHLIEAQVDAYFDLLFQPGKDRLMSLLSLNKPVFLSEVIHTLPTLINAASPAIELKTPLSRLNAWPTFLKRDLIELATDGTRKEEKAAGIFSALGWKCKWVPDIPGLISARVIAMVINEAYFTLQDEVSTKEEIDIAMKLGTNYPYGPFEWSELIGLRNIYQLLEEMSKTDLKYKACDLLREETEQLSAWH
jgi:3-hydroxybutyryl-CoA dehydrogenase